MKTSTSSILKRTLKTHSNSPFDERKGRKLAPKMPVETLFKSVPARNAKDFATSSPSLLFNLKNPQCSCGPCTKIWYWATTSNTFVVPRRNGMASRVYTAKTMDTKQPKQARRLPVPTSGIRPMYVIRRYICATAIDVGKIGVGVSGAKLLAPIKQE